MNKPTLLKDQMPLISQLSGDQVQVAKAHGLPLFKGRLFEKVEDDYGMPILKPIGDNTVVLGGTILALEHLCNATASFKPATLNTIYNINKDVASDNMQSFISLFGVGTGGAALDFGNVIATDVKQRDLLSPIPLRYGAAVTGTDANKYFFKIPNDDGTTFRWLLKEFSEVPTIKSLWKDGPDEDTDGTEITEEIYNSVRTEGIESFAEFSIKLNTSDVREYFEAIGQLDQARYNTLGLYTGQKVQLTDGSYDYVNVRLFSALSFDNRSVKMKNTAEFLYRVYSLA